MQFFSSSQRALKIAGCSAGAALLLGLASAHGQATYTTNFDDQNVFFPGQTIDQDDGWTDSAASQPDVVGLIPNFSLTGTDQAEEFGGGFFRGNTTDSPVFISHGFTPGANSYSFGVDFKIGQSGTPNLQDNEFAYTFRSNTGNVFSIDFYPQTGASANVYDAIRVTTYNTAGQANQTTTGEGIALGSRYHLGLSVNVVTGLLSYTVTLEDGNGVANGAAMSFSTTLPNSGLGVTSIAATYELGPGTSAGDNVMAFDNFSAVPEPSTYAMLGLGLVGLAARFRRKARV